MSLTRLLLGLLFFAPPPVFNAIFTSKIHAAGKFEFSPTARLAYNKILSLKFSEGQAQLNRLRQIEPDNLMVHFIENYADCLKIFISEDKNEFNRLLPNRARRIGALAQGDRNSPYFLFTQAQVRLFWAMSHAKFGEYVTAFNEVNEAFGQLEQNQKKFPNFMPNKMSLGIMHALVGSIPDNFKWGLKIVSGLNGTILQGQNEIEEVIRHAKNNDFVFEQEAIVLYAFLMLHLNNQPENAWQTVNSNKLKPAENLLATFALANVAMRTGRNDRAIELLQNRPTGAAYYPFHYLDFLLGSAKLYRNDADADQYFHRFLSNFQGLNYIKEAYQKKAWHYLLHGNPAAYRQNMGFAKQFGNTNVGGDRNALKEAKAGALPNRDLLQARVLFDGGYFQKAYTVLSSQNENTFANDAEKLEFNYRMGRILQAMNQPNDAANYYNIALQTGRNKRVYYACAAALQLGIIYEQSGQYPKSREFYGYCLSLNPDDHADGLHAKAKTGLSRIRGK
ncbi:MAG: hypothetical protein RL757_2911 [Bacteroidota bacterium]|jgi:tetratricopeptide (TPR) repeat protein